MISFLVTIPMKIPLSSITGTKFWFMAFDTRSSMFESMEMGSQCILRLTVLRGTSSACLRSRENLFFRVQRKSPSVIVPIYAPRRLMTGIAV